MDTKKNTVILKSSDDWRKWIEQLRSEATKENIWQYIDLNPSGMRAEGMPPTMPQLPVIDLTNLVLSHVLMQKYAIGKASYDSELMEYRKHQKRMKEMRAFILDTVHIGHKYLILENQDISEMLAILQRKLAPKENQEKARLTKKHRELSMPKRGIKPKDLSQKWRDFIMDIRLTGFHEVSEERLARDFIAVSEFVIPKFYDIWNNRMIEFDMDLETSGLIDICFPKLGR